MAMAMAMATLLVNLPVFYFFLYAHMHKSTGKTLADNSYVNVQLIIMPVIYFVAV